MYQIHFYHSKHLKSSRKAFQFLVSSFQSYDKREAEAIAFLILEKVFDLSKTKVLLDVPIPTSQDKTLQAIVGRVNAGEPVQYILGETDFYGRKFKVNPHVLIPRPETEELVDLIVQEHRTKKGLHVLDMCTGSGCIAISLSRALQDSKVFASDISEDALKVAKANAALNKTSVRFILADALLPSSGEFKGMDLLVSNPPYVLPAEAAFMHKNVLEHEPHWALFVPEADPLLFYRSIAIHGRGILNRGGSLYFEINETKGGNMFHLLDQCDYENIRIMKDLHGKDRFAAATLK